MKRSLLILPLLTVLSFFLLQCSPTAQEGLDPPTGRVTFSPESLRVENNRWQAGDKIGIYALPAGQRFEDTFPQASNLPYSAEEAAEVASFTADDPATAIVMPQAQSEALDFYAYYPYSSSAKEQSKIDIAYRNGERLVDLIYSDNARGVSQESHSNNRVALSFRHVMSELVVRLSNAEGSPLEGAKVSISVVPLSASFYIPTCTFSEIGERGEMELFAKGNGIYSTILIPNLGQSETKIRIEHQDKTYGHPVAIAAFEGGKRYTVTLKLNAVTGVAEEVVSANAAISDRDTGEFVSGEVTPDEEKPDDTLPSKENNYLGENIVGNPELLEVPRPTGGEHNYFVTHNVNGAVNYSLEYDTKLRATRFVAFTFDHSNSQKNVKRQDAWGWDPSIPSRFAVDRTDFSGYSRGHLVASNDRVNSRPANGQTFYYSNMTPQSQEHNAGVWLQLEALLQGWARNDDLGGDVYYIAKGCTPEDKGKPGFVMAQTSTGIPVSRYLWMAVVYKKGSDYYGLAFLTEHDKPKRVTSIRTLAMSIDELEKFTGYDFFFNLPDDVEGAVEKQNPADYLHIWPGI